jgi:hypothetical protein
VLSHTRWWIASICTLVVCTPSDALAQAAAVRAPSPTTVWVGGGYGRGVVGEGFPHEDQAWSLNVSRQRGTLLLSGRVAAVSDDTGEASWDAGVLGGVASSPAYPVHGGVAVGLAYGESGSGKGMVAVPAEVQLAWRFSRHAGIGVYAFASLSEATFAGVNLALQLGRLR